MNLFLYVEATSWLHRADPRTKIFSMFCVFFLALGLNGPSAVLALGCAVMAAGFSAGFASGLRRIGGLLCMLLVMITVLWGVTTGNVPLWGPFKSDGMLQGLTMGIKMVIMVTTGLIWLSSTKIEEMTAGMEKLGIPYPVAFAFSTAIRLVPWIVSSCLTVGEAQQSRGLDLHHGSFLRRMRNYVPLFIPALIAVIRNANYFSMALESRGFGSQNKRVSYLQIGFGSSDVALIIATILVSALCLWLNEGSMQSLLWNGLILLTFFVGFILVLRIVVNRESGRALWLNTRMVVLTAMSAAIYAAVVIPFKGIVFVPGVTEFRPGMALPPVLGVLFGPAAAWGSGFGCVISDFFGSLSPGSFFGFAGNYVMAWLPYHLWWKTGLVRTNDLEPLRLDSMRKIVNFFVLAIVGALSCAFIIGWGLELIGLVPFKVLTVLIAVNNSAPILLLSLPVMMVLYPRIKKWGLLWTDILDPAEVAASVQQSWVGAVITLIGIVVGFGGGLYVAIGLSGNPLPVAGIGIGLLIVGAFL
ncbi:MAG TPA: CbiQ family ECF transporter T component [Negativicutes bacterium]|nr:CbiQ family ECF transporter T component [Negativicutes bacterium]